VEEAGVMYLSGKLTPNLPAMITPRMGQRPFPGQAWAADNGRYASPEDYTDESYLAWLAKMPAESCLFATAPDVVGDAAATIEMSTPMLSRIRAAGYRVAFVAQDGLELLTPPWSDFDVLFIGGSTEWKLGAHAARLVNEAKLRGKWVHMGRVNSLRRMKYAESIGCDSADGTFLRFRPSGRPDLWVDHVLANPSLWRGVA
jgi:hypothetical protein